MNEIKNKKALVEALATKCDMTKKAATEVFETVIEEIVTALQNGDKVDISGFGKFEVRERPERQGINPATKERITVAASKAPAFKAAKALKDAVK